MAIYLVFGATGGIGNACVKLLMQKQENTIVCVGRDLEKLEALKRDSEYENIRTITSDLSNHGAVNEVFNTIETTMSEDSGFEKIKGVVYASGIEGVCPLRAISDQFFENVINVNLLPFIQVCKCMSSKRYSNDGASIVAISSFTALSLGIGEGAYGISKVALNAAVQQAALEMASRKIRVNAILPATTDTNMINKVRERVPDFDSNLVQWQPFGIIDPIQVAFLTEFLLSENSRFITGACVPISAGRKHY